MGEVEMRPTKVAAEQLNARASVSERKRQALARHAKPKAPRTKHSAPSTEHVAAARDERVQSTQGVALPHEAAQPYLRRTSYPARRPD